MRFMYCTDTLINDYSDLLSLKYTKQNIMAAKIKMNFQYQMNIKASYDACILL